MSGKYKEYQQLDLPSIGRDMLAQWEAGRAFEKSVEEREGAEPFVFYEGPPSANGLPGIHHVISRTLKDLVCRYKTMKGFQVKRKGGWDTHGLPVELGVEKMLGITKEDIGKKISIAEYNATCRREVLKYKDKWDDLTRRMGYWVDLKDPYITFENNYIETLWWVLNELYKKGYLYESVSIQPYSPAAGTGLSSHELNQPGTYKDVKDTSVVAMFKAVLDPKSRFLFDAAAGSGVISGAIPEVFFMAWTTTPWTLPSNLGLTVGPNIEYVLVKTFNPYTHLPVNVVLAKALIGKYFKPEGENGNFDGFTEGDKLLPWKILGSFSGSELADCRYGQLLPYEANSADKAGPGADPFRVLIGDFVTTEDGTGIVHTAPAFGADDYKVGKKFNIGLLVMVDKQGKFIDGLGEFSNRYVKNYKDDPNYVDVNVDICVKLKKENRAFKIEKYEHNYPHCWRTDKPILYYPLDAWFIRTTAMKDRMVELNKTINWKPRSTGEGRFGNWLENMVDWNLSRSRYWGTPLPIWRSSDGSEEVCIGSLEDLKNRIAASNEWHLGKDRLRQFDTEREVFLGKKAFEYQLTHQKDVEYAMARPDLKDGFIHFLWGREGDTAKGFSGGYGTAMIIAKRKWEAENDPELKDMAIDAVFAGIATVLASGKIAREFGPDESKRVELQDDEYSVIIARYLHDSTYNWLVTGFRRRKKNTVDTGSDSALTDATHIIPTLNRDDMGAVSDVKGKDIFINPIFRFKTEDLHKPFVDDIFFISPSGKSLHRIPDLVDVWFDSGSMPYAQWHFPFENKEIFEKNFPADFIAEGVDQTRGWFYTLHVLAAMLFDSVAYKTCVSNGLVLDKKGNKMSKRVGNVINPFDTIEKFGPDATRWYMITNASPWESMKFDIEGIREAQRKFFGTLYNTYQFFALYANVDGFAFREAAVPLDLRPEIDRWILSSLNTLIGKVTAGFDDYEPTLAGRLIEDFVDEHLSNWYVRLCRRRFWKGEYERDKICAYQTLYECLETVARLMAPVSPFFADWLYGNLDRVTGRLGKGSVHHTDFPVVQKETIDTALEDRMQLAQDASSLILSLRKKANIKVRQPLQKVLIPVLDPAMKQQLRKVEDLIKSEVNVKEVQYLTAADGFIKKKIKPNFLALGKKLGSKMKPVSAALGNFSQDDISKLEKEGQYTLLIDNEPLILEVNEVEIASEDIPGWVVANKDALTVALDVTVTPALADEGNARELVNRIQKIRKDNGYDLTDRIQVKLANTPTLKDSLTQFKDYICAEILADSLEWVSEIANGTEIEVNDILLKVFVTKKA
jgi:isoleucyl-tRNA synthetase